VQESLLSVPFLFTRIEAVHRGFCVLYRWKLGGLKTLTFEVVYRVN